MNARSKSFGSSLASTATHAPDSFRPQKPNNDWLTSTPVRRGPTNEAVSDGGWAS